MIKPRFPTATSLPLCHLNPKALARESDDQIGLACDKVNLIRGLGECNEVHKGVP